MKKKKNPTNVNTTYSHLLLWRVQVTINLLFSIHRYNWTTSWVGHPSNTYYYLLIIITTSTKAMSLMETYAIYWYVMTDVIFILFWFIMRSVPKLDCNFVGLISWAFHFFFRLLFYYLFFGGGSWKRSQVPAITIFLAPLPKSKKTAHEFEFFLVIISYIESVSPSCRRAGILLANYLFYLSGMTKSNNAFYFF